MKTHVESKHSGVRYNCNLCEYKATRLNMLADWLTGWEWLGRDSQENVMVDLAWDIFVGEVEGPMDLMLCLQTIRWSRKAPAASSWTQGVSSITSTTAP